MGLYYRFTMHCIKIQFDISCTSRTRCDPCSRRICTCFRKTWSCHCNIGTRCNELSNRYYGCNDGFIPLVVFTGQVATTVIGTDAFQEADIIGITQPITKHNYQVKDVADFPRIIKEAFHIASTGRPGPVLVDIPKNIATEYI